jgi:hypothetical protein
MESENRQIAKAGYELVRYSDGWTTINAPDFDLWNVEHSDEDLRALRDLIDEMLKLSENGFDLGNDFRTSDGAHAPVGDLNTGIWSRDPGC